MRRPTNIQAHLSPAAPAGRTWRALAAAAACAVAALSPAPALATTTAGVADGTLTVAGGSERNDVKVSWYDGGWIVVEDEEANLTPGPGCVAAGEARLACDGSGVTQISVDAGAGNDSITNFTSSTSVLRGGPGADTIYGGWGADTLEGGGEADLMYGSAGADRLDGGPGAEILNGGTGVDTAVYASRAAPVSVSINGTADDGESGEGDNVSTEAVELGTGDDVFTGNASSNSVIGGAGDDQLDGAAGDDTLEGGEGKDSYTGGAGADLVRSRDTTGESVDCGPDADSALIDPGDGTTNCEQVDVSTAELPLSGESGGSGGNGAPTGAPGPSDLVQGLRLRPPANATLVVSPAGNIVLSAECPADYIGGCSGTITLRLVDSSGRVVSARRRKRKRKRRVGRRPFSVQPGGTSTIRVRVSRRGRRVIARRKGRVRLRTEVRTVAANGATTTTSRTFRVKASRRSAKRPRKPKRR